MFTFKVYISSEQKLQKTSDDCVLPSDVGGYMREQGKQTTLALADVVAKNVSTEASVDGEAKDKRAIPLRLDYQAGGRYENEINDLVNWSSVRGGVPEDVKVETAQFLAHYYFLASHLYSTAVKEITALYAEEDRVWVSDVVRRHWHRLRTKRGHAVGDTVRYTHRHIADVLGWTQEERDSAYGFWGSPNDVLRKADRRRTQNADSQRKRRQPARDKKAERDKAIITALEASDSPSQADYVRVAQLVGCSANTVRNVFKRSENGTLQALTTPTESTTPESGWAELYRKKWGREPVVAPPRFTDEDRKKRKARRAEVVAEEKARVERNSEFEETGILPDCPL